MQNAEARRPDLIRRLCAGFTLFALFAGFFPHLHAEPQASAGPVGHAYAAPAPLDNASADTLSADDAHDEHSSVALTHATPCALCRSTHERANAALGDPLRWLLAADLRPSLPRFDRSAVVERLARQNPGRAPPAPFAA